MLTGIRRAYRSLPLSLRKRLTWLSRPVLAEMLAWQLPPRGSVGVQSEGAVVAGLLSTPHGVGMAARLCLAELAAAGIPTRAIDLTAALNAPSEPMTPILTARSGDQDAIILHLNPDILAPALLTLDKAELTKRRIGYWVWELERAPDKWEKDGRYVHEIWAPSRFAADAIRAVLPHHSVTVVPHPVALAGPLIDPTRRGAARARFGVDEDDFLALASFSMSSGFERKNPLAAIRAFHDAFAGRGGARLVVRCRDAHAFPPGLQALRAAVREAGDLVVLIDEPGDDDTLPALYAACDAYLSLHRSEGFGLNLAEAMLCGKPVVATAWSGNMDFMEEGAAALVPADLIPVVDPQRIYRQRSARWAAPNRDVAVAHLRALAADPTHRAALGAAGAELARARLSGGAAAAALRGDGRDAGPLTPAYTTARTR